MNTNRTIKVLSLVLFAFASVGLTGCYTDTVDSFSTLTFQLPVNKQFGMKNIRFSDTTSEEAGSMTRVDLREYEIYRDNQENIRIVDLFQLGYWFDTLAGNPSLGDAEFEFIELYLRLIGGKEKYLLGRYENVVAREYYKRLHIISTSDNIPQGILDSINRNPQFDMILRLSRPTSRRDSLTFPIIIDTISSNVDLVVRLEGNLW